MARGGYREQGSDQAVRLVFRSEGQALNDEQVEPVVRAIVEQLASTLGARQRG